MVEVVSEVEGALHEEVGELLDGAAEAVDVAHEVAVVEEGDARVLRVAAHVHH